MSHCCLSEEDENWKVSIRVGNIQDAGGKINTQSEWTEAEATLKWVES